MNNFPVAKEAFPYLLVSGVIFLVFIYIHPWLSTIPLLFFLFTLFFFRNPNRKIKFDSNTVLSPADGVVMDVSKVREERFLNQEVWKVSIFLNVFNVHINRLPVEGTIEAIHYIPGKFLPAYKSHASEINERNYVIINTGKEKLMVSQITGFIARRIVCWVKKGDKLKQGDRFGLIKFGSCTEVYLPLGYTITVQKDTKVRGGITIIGRKD